MSKVLTISARMVISILVLLALVGTQVASAQSPTDPRGDFDGDGLPNNMDADDDNDGVTDENDAYPFDASRSVREAAPTSPPSAPTSPPPAPTSPPALPTAPTVPMPTIPAPAPDTEHEGPRGNLGGGAGPTPSTIDRDADSDGDGISNSHDPDDDNDGVPDDKDCAPFDPSVTVCSDPEPTATPTSETSGPAPANQSGSVHGGDGARAGVGGSGALLVTSLPVTGGGLIGMETGMQWILLAIATACAGFAMLLRHRVR